MVGAGEVVGLRGGRAGGVVAARCCSGILKFGCSRLEGSGDLVFRKDFEKLCFMETSDFITPQKNSSYLLYH